MRIAAGHAYFEVGSDSNAGFDDVGGSRIRAPVAKGHVCEGVMGDCTALVRLTFRCNGERDARQKMWPTDGGLHARQQCAWQPCC